MELPLTASTKASVGCPLTQPLRRSERMPNIRSATNSAASCRNHVFGHGDQQFVHSGFQHISFGLVFHDAVQRYKLYLQYHERAHFEHQLHLHADFFDNRFDIQKLCSHCKYQRKWCEQLLGWWCIIHVGQCERIPSCPNLQHCFRRVIDTLCNSIARECVVESL
jgi:hypothetical protein